MTNSLSTIASTPFCGLGTQTYGVLTTGNYVCGVNVTIPWQAAGTGTAPNPEVQDITLVADSAGSLNSTWFKFYTAGDAYGYYVWYNINSAGVDPAPSGLTGIEVAGATNATANTLATATRAAIAAAVSSSLVSISGGTSHVIITNVQAGECTAASNGTASPGFSYSVTTTGSFGTASGLVVKVKKNSTVLMTLSQPTPTQPSLSGSVSFAATAGDSVTVVLSSLADADQALNAVKGIINIYQGVG